MTDRFDRDVLGVAETTHVVIMAGINDLGLPPLLRQQRPTADDLVGGLFALAHRARQHGIQPILGTITPFAYGGRQAESPNAHDNETIRQAVNHAVRTQKDWPVADFAASLAAPDDPAQLNPVYDSGDGLHPADAGAAALADAVDLALLS
jgi:lysophospholipase L1-like esterase